MHVRSHALALLPWLGGCAVSSVVPLWPASLTAPHTRTPLEVHTRSAAVPSIVRVRGSRVAYAGVEDSVGRAIVEATASWAATRADGRWELLIDLWQARAERRGPQITVALGVRATLRGHDGNQYVAQTQVHCQEAALVDARHAAPVFYDCMSQLGHELGGWLYGIEPQQQQRP